MPGACAVTGKSAWDAVVRKAVELGVDVVTLSGDVVEHDNAWFEAYGALDRGLDQLEKNNIKIFAVAGNHDASVFPRLASSGSSIVVLGLHGKWEYADFKGVRFAGWSFPGDVCRENPMKGLPHEFSGFAGPVLGLLHCDIDVSDSPYAPVPGDMFRDSGIPLWALGHIHKPEFFNSLNALYCGSPFPMDSSETGGHGAWLIEAAGNSWKNPEFISLSPWRFEKCVVTLKDADTEEALSSSVIAAMRHLGETMQAEGECGDVYAKLVVEGSVSGKLDVKNALPSDSLQLLEVPLERVTVHACPDLTDRTMPAVDLLAMAAGKGPQALLAAYILEPGKDRDLLAEIVNIDDESWNTAAFRPLRKKVESCPGEDVEEIIRRAANKLLRAMLDQEKYA